ncbi:hypothetical protein [Flexithrix dorotheae]|uniref:hypothetical protein n=1 Tax=Flexithrix dorotheae TaxID=70993 RepID=UPI000362A97F|nr:hypothetical protein [Flexithrix dorotheae]
MIFRKISYGFHFIAILFLLGHMMVPHVHNNIKETSILEPCHSGDKGLLGMLEHVFSINLGGDHLQELVKDEVAKSNLKDYSQPILCPNFIEQDFFVFSAIQANNLDFWDSIIPFKNHIFLNSPGLRAPPYLFL